MKDRNKESLDKEYNSEDCIRYGYDNLNHDDYLINEITNEVVDNIDIRFENKIPKVIISKVKTASKI